MNFITDNPKQLYSKFLMASMTSALVMSVYSFVDAIAVGQSEGELGAAAMAVITPLYGIIIFLAILCGIGGSVLMSNAKGEGKDEKGNAYFTASLLIMGLLTAIAWVGLALFHKQIFAFFGADETIMPKLMEYAKWLIWTFPVFVIPTFLGSFIRNDGAPTLAMAAVIIGGCINIFGDWFLCFPLGMGMEGAAIASVTGTTVQGLIMCSHFFKKKCGLKLVKPFDISKGVRKILEIGFGASVLDLGVVIISVLMNNQIMKYGGTVELAVYGVAATVASLFQALFSGVGQAIQPLVSVNFGAGENNRVKRFWKMSLTTVIVLGVIFTAIGELFPTQIVRLFVNVTPEMLTVAPTIIRLYFLYFLFLGITVLSTYYLQSIMQDKLSMVIALLRSVVISTLLIFILPLAIDINGVWLALPISELIVAVVALFYISMNVKITSK